MKKLTAQWGSWRADGLRMRFRPRSRIGQALLLVVPWINFGVVMLLFLALGSRVTLQPGIVFELPQTRFREGLHRGPKVVMLSVARPQGAETLVFFDDARYRLDITEQRDLLRAELVRQTRRPDGRQLLLLADRRVPHGDVVALVDLARACGVQRVNVSIKPD